MVQQLPEAIKTHYILYVLALTCGRDEKKTQQFITENTFILKRLSYIDTRVLLFIAFYK